MTRYYPSDLTDQQWQYIKSDLPLPRPGGRPRTTKLRRVVNAILYLLRSGCAWRYLPKQFPPWQTVYDYFCKWSHCGVWQRVVHDLHYLVRLAWQRSYYPHLGIIDSQTVKATHGEAIGNDGHKKIRGRRRHVLVDVLGIILCCKLYEGNLSDADGGVRVLEKTTKEISEHLETIVADAAYAGKFWAQAHLKDIDVEITKRRGEEKDNMFPKRWIVERTFAWLNNYRRLVRDYERKTVHSESMLYIAMLPILLRRLCP